MIYVLNSPVLTGYGCYEYQGPISVEEAARRLSGEFDSAIGHAATAAFLSGLLGIDVPMRRKNIAMQPGDAALVLRLRGTKRLPEGGVLSAEQLANMAYELSWLRRVR